MSRSIELTCELDCWAVEDVAPPHAILCEGTKPLVPMLFSSKAAALEECDELRRPYRVHVIVAPLQVPR